MGAFPPFREDFLRRVNMTTAYKREEANLKQMNNGLFVYARIPPALIKYTHSIDQGLLFKQGGAGEEGRGGGGGGGEGRGRRRRGGAGA